MDSQFLPPPQRGPAQPDMVTGAVQRITAPSSVSGHSTSLLFMAQAASRGIYTPQILDNSILLIAYNSSLVKYSHSTKQLQAKLNI